MEAWIFTVLCATCDQSLDTSTLRLRSEHRDAEPVERCNAAHRPCGMEVVK